MKTTASLLGLLTISLIVAGCGGSEFNFPTQDAQYPEKGIAVTPEGSRESAADHEQDLLWYYEKVEFLSQSGSIHRFKVSGLKLSPSAPSKSARSSVPAVVKSESASNNRLVGVYECPTPMWALELQSDGSYVMEARDSGNSFRGNWSASGTSGLLEGTFPSKATMTFTIQSDGAIVLNKYGYTFVRTR